MANHDIGPRPAAITLLLVLLFAGVVSTIGAYQKPFWFDEVFSIAMSGIPTVQGLWQALEEATDGNPPLFHLVTRLAVPLAPDQHIGYRLPAIAGLLLTIVCLYCFLARTSGRMAALTGSAFVMGTMLAAFGYEARPYGLMVGCIAAAMLAWQRIDNAKIMAPLTMAVFLALAISLHYYALMVLSAFVLAECAVWKESGRLRVRACVALLAACIPLLFLAPLVLHFREKFGTNFWSRPGYTQIFDIPGLLFNLGGYWGWCLSAAAAVVVWRYSFAKTTAQTTAVRGPSFPEAVLMTGLLFLPTTAVIAARITGGGMTQRYVLPAVLGGALAVGFLAGRVPVRARWMLMVLMFLHSILVTEPLLRKVIAGSLLAERETLIQRSGSIRAIAGEPQLPLVVSSGMLYMPLAYYTPAGQRENLYTFADPKLAIALMGTDSVDGCMLLLRPYFPVQVEDFDNFRSKHREFLMVSRDLRRFDYWPTKLLRDGHRLVLLSSEGDSFLYRVTLRNAVD